jgi:hypothetical protein
MDVFQPSVPEQAICVLDEESMVPSAKHCDFLGTLHGSEITTAPTLVSLLTEAATGSPSKPLRIETNISITTWDCFKSGKILYNFEYLIGLEIKSLSH